MALAVMRGVAAPECLSLALDPDRDMNTPMAPELGLFLVRLLRLLHCSCRSRMAPYGTVLAWHAVQAQHCLLFVSLLLFSSAFLWTPTGT
jgi:hypothetical protein